MAVHAAGSPAALGSNIGAVASHLIGIHGIGQVRFENIVADPAHQLRLRHGYDHFDTAIQIARHQVSAADVHFLLTAVAEIVDPAVLQKPADYTDDPDVLADAGHTRPQTGQSPHQQINLDATLRCPVKQLDHFRVLECIHLENEMPLFEVDQVFEPLSHVNRSYE